MQNFKDILEDIFPEIMSNNKEINKDMNIIDIIPFITPGTELRKGLDEILNGGNGAIIVLGTNIVLESIIRGGFKLDIEFSPQKLFELSKMDGAIILSKDLNKIVYANIHLMPDKTISSTQTGIRHRSAEQTAKQTLLPVVAISKRRKIITLFFKDQKYVLKDLNVLFTKATHSLRTLQNYRMHIDKGFEELTYHELNNSVSIEFILKLIQNIIYLYKHQKELERIILELGEEGKEIKQSMYEYTLGLEKSLKLLLKDYAKKDISLNEFFDNIKDKEIKELVDLKNLSVILGLEKRQLDEIIIPKGYRILSKIPKLSKLSIEQTIEEFDNINNILQLKEKDLNINENQAKTLVSGLKKIYENNVNKLL